MPVSASSDSSASLLEPLASSRRGLWLALGLAALTGVCLALGFLFPAVGVVAFVALVPLTLALRLVTSHLQALLVGWCAGVVFHLVGYHWFVTLFEQFAQANRIVAVAGTVGFAVAQGSLHAALAVLAYALGRRGHMPLGWAVVVALLGVEYAYPSLFPTYLGNHLATFPLLTQAADLGGPLLVSALAALVSAGIEEVLSARLRHVRTQRALPALALAALVANVGYGAFRIANVDATDARSPKLHTAIVQANVGAGDKHLRANEGIERYRTMTDEVMAQGAHDLVVWPESAYNRTLRSDITSLQGKVATDVKVPMIVGALRREQSGTDKASRKLWNSALAVDSGGDIVGRYDKTVLLAFGEYVPGLTWFPAIAKLLPFTAQFEFGTSKEPLTLGGYRLSTNICYEDTIAGHVRALMGVLDDKGFPSHAMVNLTNDSWYGPVEPPIHLALASFRAIEHRRWMIRATATGISAVVDPAGRVRAHSDFERAEVVAFDVPMITGPRTAYAVVGDWPGWCALGLVAWSLARSRWRRGPAVTV